VQGLQHAFYSWQTYKKFWSENLKGKRPLRRPERRWYDNIRMDLMETEWEVVD